MKDIRLLHPHAAKCVYRDAGNNPGSPWFLRDGPYWRNYRTFISLVCNDPDCDAELRVRTAVFEDAVPTFLPTEEPKHA